MDEPTDGPRTKAYDFNEDPAWQRYVQRFEKVILAIAMKYCSNDEDLREDVQQEARIALATLRPEQVKGHESYARGHMGEQQWNDALDRYCRNAIRNAVLSYLDSYVTGQWNIGRTRHVRDRVNGRVRKVSLPPRFSSLDELTDDYGMQVDQHGNISWPDPSDDGLPRLVGKTSDRLRNWADPHPGGNTGRWLAPELAPEAER